MMPVSGGCPLYLILKSNFVSLPCYTTTHHVMKPALGTFSLADAAMPLVFCFFLFVRAHSLALSEFLCWTIGSSGHWISRLLELYCTQMLYWVVLFSQRKK